MKYANLGRSGAKVSRLVLGTMNFGPYTDETDAHAIMDRALAEGINFFDTANVYGAEDHTGWTEEIVGRWLAKSDHREQVVLGTKVFGRMSDRPNDRGLSALHIRRAVDASLRRLQTDHIDLYQMHHIDRDTPWNELWQAMDTLVAQGKIIYVGSSNFAGWHIAAASEAARSRHPLGLVSEQSLYNLTARHLELEVLPAAQHYGLGVIAWSPLAGGLLGARPADGGSRRLRPRAQENAERLGERLDRWQAFCAERSLDPAVTALAWVLRQPGVLGPITGPRTMTQLEAALPAVDTELDAATLAAIDDIFPGPGGPAPEAYAW